MPQQQGLSEAQQKFDIMRKMDSLKKTLRELNAAISTLERGFLDGTVPNVYYLSQGSPDPASFKAKFWPIAYHAGLIQDKIVGLAYDVFKVTAVDFRGAVTDMKPYIAMKLENELRELSMDYSVRRQIEADLTRVRGN